jgi:hypothetical protein
MYRRAQTPPASCRKRNSSAKIHWTTCGRRLIGQIFHNLANALVFDLKANVDPHIGAHRPAHWLQALQKAATRACPSGSPTAVHGEFVNLHKNEGGADGVVSSRVDIVLPSMSMIHLLILAVHLLATIAKLTRSGGVRAVVAESLLLKHQLVISSRARRRAPNLNSFDRFVLGLGSLFVPASRLPKLAAIPNLEPC